MSEFKFSPPRNRAVSDEDLLADLNSIAIKSGNSKLSMRQYVESGGKYDPSTILRRFNSWREALSRIGFQAGNVNIYSDEELFENIYTLWKYKGSQPVRRDLLAYPSMISQGPYNRRFRSWSDALESFVAYANESEYINNTEAIPDEPKLNSGRDPSLRLRFKVLKRDNFSCRQCGASPAKALLVELHVDHIKPWSKGGQTDIDNLQTLCCSCNLGKSNFE